MNYKIFINAPGDKIKGLLLYKTEKIQFTVSF